MATFHERLKELKEQSGGTQASIAKALGLTPQAFSYYLNGREPNFETLIKMAKYFEVTTDYLLGASECRSAENDDINKRLGLSDEAIFWLEKDINPDANAIRALNAFLSQDYAKYILKDIDNYCLYSLINDKLKHICLKNFLNDYKIELPENEIEERSVHVFEVENLWADIREMWDKKIEFEHYFTNIEIKYSGTLFTTDLDYKEYKVAKSFKDILFDLNGCYYDFPALETNVVNYFEDLFKLTEQSDILEFFWSFNPYKTGFLPTDYKKPTE